MSRRLGIFALAAALAVCTGIAAVGSAAAQSQPGITTVGIPVTATASGGASIEGTFNLRRFTARDNMLYAVGTLDADVAGVGRIADEPMRVTVQRIESSCTPASFRVVLGPVNVEASEAGTTFGTATPVDIQNLALGVTAEEGDQFLNTILCGVNNVMTATVGGGTLDLSGANLPVPAQDVARLLNRAIRLLA